MKKFFLSAGNNVSESGRESGVPDIPVKAGGIRVTDVKIKKMLRYEKLKAVASVTLNDEWVIHGIKVIDGTDRLFVAMPNRKDEYGAFRDIAHPITPETRRILEESVLCVYRAYLEDNPEPI